MYFPTDKIVLKVDDTGRIKVEKEIVEVTLDFIDEDTEKSSMYFKYIVIFLFSMMILWVILDVEYLIYLIKG